MASRRRSRERSDLRKLGRRRILGAMLRRSAPIRPRRKSARNSGRLWRRRCGPILASRDEMGEDERVAPGERASRRADGAIFVAVVRLHQDRRRRGRGATAAAACDRSAIRIRSRGTLAAGRRRSRSRREAMQLTQAGPAGLFSSGISSAEQHIVHAPQVLPGAAAKSIVSLLAARIDVAPLSPSTIFQPWASPLPRARAPTAFRLTRNFAYRCLSPTLKPLDNPAPLLTVRRRPCLSRRLF